MTPNKKTDGWRAELTIFKKVGGVMSKRIWLADGKLMSDGSACAMSVGEARRAPIVDIDSFAKLIDTCHSHEAIALGRLQSTLPNTVNVVTKAKLNGKANVIARTRDNLVFTSGQGGFALLDFDPKEMSETVRHRFNECDDLFSALCLVLPDLKTAAMVERASTSSGLRHAKTGEIYPSSGGKHIYVAVSDVSDVPRFLSDLHAGCWLAGFGWGASSKAGTFLERSIVDKACGTPERLIFEGAPIIEKPLEQSSRKAIVREGMPLNTRCCAPLTDAERAKLRDLLEAEKARLHAELVANRFEWGHEHICRLVQGGMSEDDAESTVDRWVESQELTGDFVLPFDKAELAGTTVADVLAHPKRFIGESLADPLEGVDYGRGKAKIFERKDGSLIVNSFAHGGVTYVLKDADEAAREAADEAELERLARLDAGKYERARVAAAKKLGYRTKALDRLVVSKRAELGINADDGKQGQAVEYPEPELWPKPVDGAPLLDEIVTTLNRFIILPPHAAETIALWVTHTYLIDASDISPRLQIMSPVKGCGKTTLLDVLGQLVFKADAASNISASSLFRTVERWRPCLLLDEADSFLEGNEDMRNVLNSGHHINGSVKRVVGEDFEPRRFRTFSPVAFALIGKLRGPLTTLADRSIRVTLSRAKTNERFESFSGPRRRDELLPLRQQLMRFARDNIERISQAEPVIPTELYNRTADNWRPLLAIADAAGGEWPKRARGIAVTAAANEEQASTLELLLADIRDTFDELGEYRLSYVEIIEYLHRLDERPWLEYGQDEFGRYGQPITQNQIGKLLGSAAIVSRQWRVGKERVRGLLRTDLEEAFERYTRAQQALTPELVRDTVTAPGFMGFLRFLSP